MRKRNKLHLAANQLRQAFATLGLDCSSPDMQATPYRYAKHLADFAANQGKLPKLTTEDEYDASKVIKLTLFDQHKVDELIIERNLDYASICAHHLLPFYGQGTIGYLPGNSIIGASKVPRLLDFFAKQPQTQEYLTQQVAEFIKEKTGARFVGVVLTGTHTCCSDDTEILTEDGFVAFPDLQKGKKVAQYYQNGKISYVEPEAYIDLPYSGEMVHIYSGEKRNGSIDLFVTPDHRCVFQSGWEREKGKDYTIRPAHALAEGRMLRCGTLRGSNPTYIRIGGSLDLPFLDYCRFMGAFLSEGCTSLDNNSVRIKQDRGSKGFNSFRSFFAKFKVPFTYTEYTETKTGKLRGVFSASSKPLAQYLRRFGKSHDKYVPKVIRHASIDARKAFLHYYWLGDGFTCASTKNDRSGYTTVSSQMADNLQEMLVTSGFGASLNPRKGNKAFDILVAERNEVPRSEVFIRSKHIRKVAYSGRVYCVSVPSGMIIVRRNGRVVVTGNCCTCRGARKPGMQMVTSCFRPSDQPVIKAEFLQLSGI